MGVLGSIIFRNFQMSVTQSNAREAGAPAFGSLNEKDAIAILQQSGFRHLLV